MIRKNIEYSKYRRTNSWKSNPDFDNFLAYSSMNDLRFLKKKREKDLNYFRKHHNLANTESFQEYRELQQTYKMICEELKYRYMDMYSETNLSGNSEPSSYSLDEEGNILLNEEDEEDDDNFTDYDMCDESIKYDWKTWCKKKGLDKY